MTSYHIILNHTTSYQYIILHHITLLHMVGTGKTLLAKAVANQTSATFLRVVGSELIQKYLGDGPKLGMYGPISVWAVSIVLVIFHSFCLVLSCVVSCCCCCFFVSFCVISAEALEGRCLHHRGICEYISVVQAAVKESI